MVICICEYFLYKRQEFFGVEVGVRLGYMMRLGERIVFFFFEGNKLRWRPWVGFVILVDFFRRPFVVSSKSRVRQPDGLAIPWDGSIFQSDVSI